MSDNRKMPGSSIWRRMSARAFRRPSFAMSPAFFERFGIPDPWSQSPFMSLQGGDDPLVYLSSRPFEKVMQRIAASRRRRERRMAQFLAEHGEVRMLAATRTWPGEVQTRSPFRFGGGLSAPEMALPQREVLPTEEASSASEASPGARSFRRAHMEATTSVARGSRRRSSMVPDSAVVPHPASSRSVDAGVQRIVSPKARHIKQDDQGRMVQARRSGRDSDRAIDLVAERTPETRVVYVPVPAAGTARKKERPLDRLGDALELRVRGASPVVAALSEVLPTASVRTIERVQTIVRRIEVLRERGDAGAIRTTLGRLGVKESAVRHVLSRVALDDNEVRATDVAAGRMPSESGTRKRGARSYVHASPLMQALVHDEPTLETDESEVQPKRGHVARSVVPRAVPRSREPVRTIETPRARGSRIRPQVPMAPTDLSVIRHDVEAAPEADVTAPVRRARKSQAVSHARRVAARMGPDAEVSTDVTASSQTVHAEARQSVGQPRKRSLGRTVITPSMVVPEEMPRMLGDEEPARAAPVERALTRLDETGTQRAQSVLPVVAPPSAERRTAAPRSLPTTDADTILARFEEAADAIEAQAEPRAVQRAVQAVEEAQVRASTPIETPAMARAVRRIDVGSARPGSVLPDAMALSHPGPEPATETGTRAARTTRFQAISSTASGAETVMLRGPEDEAAEAPAPTSATWSLRGIGATPTEQSARFVDAQVEQARRGRTVRRARTAEEGTVIAHRAVPPDLGEAEAAPVASSWARPSAGAAPAFDSEIDDTDERTAAPRKPRRRRSLQQTLGQVASGDAGGDAPVWAERASGRARISGANELMDALAKAQQPEEVVRLITERSTEMKQLSSTLPKPMAQLIRQMSTEASSSSSSSSSRRRSASPRTRTRVATRFVGLRRASTTRSVNGVGADRVMGLAQKLQNLIHLAETGKRDAARDQVRMAEDTGAARAEGQAALGGAEAMDATVDVERLQREVLDYVMREQELRRERRLEDKEDAIWW